MGYWPTAMEADGVYGLLYFTCVVRRNTAVGILIPFQYGVQIIIP